MIQHLRTSQYRLIDSSGDPTGACYGIVAFRGTLVWSHDQPSSVHLNQYITTPSIQDQTAKNKDCLQWLVNWHESSIPIHYHQVVTIINHSWLYELVNIKMAETILGWMQLFGWTWVGTHTDLTPAQTHAHTHTYMYRYVHEYTSWYVYSSTYIQRLHRYVNIHRALSATRMHTQYASKYIHNHSYIGNFNDNPQASKFVTSQVSKSSFRVVVHHA